MKKLIASIIATSAMTIFSYYVSRKKHKQFREPQLLAEVLKDIQHKPKVQSPELYSGFLIHYLVGYSFVFMYKLLWDYSSLKPNIKDGMVIGFVNGIFGAAVWKLTFMLKPGKAETQELNYLLHLVLAHVVFGATLSKSYKILDKP